MVEGPLGEGEPEDPASDLGGHFLRSVSAAISSSLRAWLGSPTGSGTAIHPT